MKTDNAMGILKDIHDMDTVNKIIKISREATDKIIFSGMKKNEMIIAGELITEAIKQIVGDADA